MTGEFPIERDDAEPLPARLLSNEELAERLAMVEGHIAEAELDLIAEGIMTPDDLHAEALERAREAYIKELKDFWAKKEFEAIEEGEVSLEEIVEISEVVGGGLEILADFIRSGQADDIIRRSRPEFPA